MAWPDTDTCSGCGGESIHDVCWDCVVARARTVAARGRCTCGRRRLEDPRARSVGSRVWYTCRRCLGTTRQVA